MQCVKDLESWLAGQDAAGQGGKQAKPPAIRHEICPPDQEGDITINCFRFAKSLKANPIELAGRVAAFLDSHDDVEKTSSIKAFVNVVLKPGALFRDTTADGEALLGAVALAPEERGRILIEFSAPNTNKPQHLGHVRNNTIGAAMAAILKRVGHTVFSVNLVNDRGIHICKSMIAYQRWGEGATPESTGTKGDHFVGGYYVRYDRALKSQLEALRKADPALEGTKDDALFLETELGAATQEMLVLWEKSDPEVRKLWQGMNGWVLDGFRETYRRMGISFDKIYLESDTYLRGRDVVEKGVEQGLLIRRDDGAVEADLEAEKLGRKILLRSDGTSVYMTQDLGTTLLKQDEFEPDRQIWVVGDEQIHHFKVLFTVLKKLGFSRADDCFHLAYGMVDLPSGKMKSREGTVVDADDLLDEMEGLARAGCMERLQPGEDPPPDLEHRCRVIGQGALKFMLLRFNPRSRVLFNPEESVRFEGDTGSYVQYACARLHSILAKAGDRDARASFDWGLLGEPEERALALSCGIYPEAMQRAAREFDPSVLAGYLLGLAKDVSRFHRTCPVLRAPEAVRPVRLELCSRVLAVLEDGLAALTIESL